MNHIHDTIIDLIGNTPMVMLDRYVAHHSLKGKIAAKLEYFNPLGSVKDRAALFMIEAAEAEGTLKKGSVIIEPTSGNTGIGLAYIGKLKGYRVILTMPESMSLERRLLLEALGAELILTPASEGMKGAIAKAAHLCADYPNSFMPQQFTNPHNPEAHKKTTGPEILQDTQGMLAAFVAGVGTGGTISGVGQVLKAHNPAIRVVAVEPASSPVLEGGNPGSHDLQGIGAGFIPENLDTTIYDEVLGITTEQAFTAAREVAQTEGLLVGISSGAALAAAKVVASRQEFSDKLIVVLFPDTGDRYLSTQLFNHK